MERPRPAVIVVQEWWGLNDNIKDIARRFAQEGYFAVAPDLYSRQGNKVAGDPNTAAQLMGGLEKPDGIEDLKSTIAWIRSQKETRTRENRRDRLLHGRKLRDAAAVRIEGDFRGRALLRRDSRRRPAPRAQLPNLLRLRRARRMDPAQGRRSAGRRSRASSAKRARSRSTPGCQHGFFNDTREDVYAPDAAKDGWQRTLALFAANLRS